MTLQRSDKEKLIDSLLESLHYGKEKEDTAIIRHLSVVFKIPKKEKLRDYLVEAVDFSELFSEVLKLVEPFAQMMNEVYGFLSDQRKTARSLEHVIVGENIQEKISFDLETFPQMYRPVIQRVEGYLRSYHLNKVLNSNISPLFLTEGLLGDKYCNDKFYQKTTTCQRCGVEMRMRFERVFQQLAQMVEIIPEKEKDKIPYRWYCRYFEEANELFHTGRHRGEYCRGYDRWSELLDGIDRRIDLVSKIQPGFYDIEVLVRFFELPFWKERNRLYEVWTLIHYVHLLKKMANLSRAVFELNIKDSQWYLMYGDAREPVAWIRGKHFKIEIWYQHKLKVGLKMFPDVPVEPEMLLIYHRDDGGSEPLVLIECKERKDYDIREVMKLSAFYRDQVSTALNIFCNYFDYSLPKAFIKSSDIPRVMLCSQFRPGSESVAETDREFVQLVSKKLDPFLSVLVDVSASMRGKDLTFVYQRLDSYLSQLSGTKSLSGVFAECVMLCDYNELIQKLRYLPNDGNGTQLKRSLNALFRELQKNDAGLVRTNIYIITDLDFGDEDWNWLKNMHLDTIYSITFVARRTWVSDVIKRQAESLERIKVKLF